MDDLLLLLEKYRKDRGISKTDMAKAFGVVPQNYNNWTYRGSLPKEHIKKASQILGLTSPASNEIAAAALQVLSDLSTAELLDLIAKAGQELQGRHEKE